MRHHQISTQSFKIITQYGDMHVVKQGVLHRHTSSNHSHHQAHHSTNAHHHQQHHPGASGGVSSSSGGGGDTQGGGSRPILMTFHDLGMNSELQFANFCERDEVKLILQTFTIMHVNFIGQEFNGQGQPVGALPDDYKYPTVEQMAECIVDVCAQLRVRSFIGLAVGAGAHIVSTLALMRPDLVHGLFLINPVISSCSITEWLYFKMSAIASNHQILGGNHGSGGGGHSALGTSSSIASSLSEDQSTATDDHHHHPHSSSSSSSGFKKLWKAVNHNHHGHQRQHHHSDRSEGAHGSGESGSESASPTPPSLSQTSSRSNVFQPNHPATPAAGLPGKPAASSSRLRQLILSRNFRLGKQQPQQQHPRRPVSAQTRDGLMSESSSATQEERAVGDAGEPPRSASAQDRRASVGSQASSNASSQVGYSGKRPPLEYLMYHHFGTASLQRFRRMSSDMQATSITGRSGQPTALPAPPPKDDPTEVDKQGGQHRDSCDSNASGQSASRFASSAVARQHRGSRESARAAGGDNDSQRSQDSLTRAGVRNQRRLLQRSHSVSLEASYLASIASDRQRTAYMQNVYKRYFTQLNAHNLWLFAQSFVKRRTLNLRKDCGAAAHAAAAAAALGTSICAAFVGGVGVGPISGSGGGATGAMEATSRGRGASSDVPAAAAKFSTASVVATSETKAGEALALKENATAAATKQGLEEARASAERIKAKVASGLSGTRATGKTTATAAASIATSTGSKEQAPAKVLVAGTKVKRTFTCQTLIMCSSVHIHRERALKLMSLLNPLQATWIKTDQLLVLEEKPEKVCQALRLFLQGIGYSMSTYERRFRLGSAQASISSADSNGSARSLNMIGTVVAAAADAGCSSTTAPLRQKASVVGGAGSASSSPFHHQKTSM